MGGIFLASLVVLDFAAGIDNLELLHIVDIVVADYDNFGRIGLLVTQVVLLVFHLIVRLGNLELVLPPFATHGLFLELRDFFVEFFDELLHHLVVVLDVFQLDARLVQFGFHRLVLLDQSALAEPSCHSCFDGQLLEQGRVPVHLADGIPDSRVAHVGVHCAL